MNTLKTQEGDVLLVHTDDNGEICVTEGLTQMDGGLRTAAYLSLFGGNDADDGSENNPAAYWGNLLETEEDKQYTSRFQHLLGTLPATLNNLNRLKDAAVSDLNWFVSSGAATSVGVGISIPALNRIKVDVTITADNAAETFTFLENWRYSA